MWITRALEHQIGGPEQGEPADTVIAALAAAQHGVVARTQLLAAGLTRRQVERRLERNRLHLVHRGVYAVGHRALSQLGVWMAAVLAAGEGAALSLWSGASLWRMRGPGGPRSHVTCPRQRRNRRAITFHHATLPPDEATLEQGIPVTTPARTLLDLAPFVPSPTLGRMIDAAPSRGVPLAELLERYPRRPGTPKLRALLRESRPMTRSDFEAGLLFLIAEAGLPAPSVNVVVEGYEVDLVWWNERVIAELDTYATHGSRAAFERDRERDRRLAIAGWTVVRLTSEAGLADLSLLLARSASHKEKGRPR